MKLTIISTSYDRKNLKPFTSRVLGYKEVEEDEFYEPLINAFYNKLKDRNFINNHKGTANIYTGNSEYDVHKKEVTKLGYRKK